MKRSLLLLVLLGMSMMSINAQTYSVKSVSLRQSDMKASTEQRKDANGKPCAVVRVGIVGVKDLTFPDAVGDVKYSMGEYIVYVPDGLQRFNYKNGNGKIAGAVSFDDYGLEVETKRVYSVTFESENHARAAIFSVQPTDAKLVLDGVTVTLDKEGIAIVEKPIGEYTYQVIRQGYLSQSGIVKLTDDEISTTTNVQLEQEKFAVKLSGYPEETTLFIDNIPYGKASDNGDLKLPAGEHNLRLTAVGYDDFEKTFVVGNQPVALDAVMTLKKQRVVEHSYERTRTHVNLRPAFYFRGGAQLYNKEQYLGHDWGLKLSVGAIQHFGVLFSLYEGIEGGLANPTNKGKEEYFEHAADSANTYFVEIPVLLGISVPLGKYNQHMFSVLGGVYGRGMLTEIVDEKSTKAADKHGNAYKTNWDFGLRGMVILDISRFSIAAEVGYSMAKFYKIDRSGSTPTKSKVSNNPSLFFGLNLGAKLGKL